MILHVIYSLNQYYHVIYSLNDFAYYIYSLNDFAYYIYSLNGFTYIFDEWHFTVSKMDDKANKLSPLSI